jgi:multiple antibiotic resistance protein
MPGNVPLIIKLRKENGEIESLKSTIIATVIMVSILFVGQTLFRLLGIETFHFALAGAMLLLYFGVKMVLGIESESNSEPMPATIFPIAFPIIAGPGTLSTIMSLTQDLSNIEIILGYYIECYNDLHILKDSTLDSKQIRRCWNYYYGESLWNLTSCHWNENTNQFFGTKCCCSSISNRLNNRPM